MPLKGLLSNVNHGVVSIEESCDSNRDTRRTANLVKVVSRKEQTITSLDMHSLDPSMFEHRPLFVVRRYKLHRRVVVWKPTPTCVDVLAIIL